MESVNDAGSTVIHEGTNDANLHIVIFCIWVAVVYLQCKGMSGDTVSLCVDKIGELLTHVLRNALFFVEVSIDLYGIEIDFHCYIVLN